MAQTATRGASPLYRDIAERTQGELYIGVVGPVRGGMRAVICVFMRRVVVRLVPAGGRGGGAAGAARCGGRAAGLAQGDDRPRHRGRGGDH